MPAAWLALLLTIQPGSAGVSIVKSFGSRADCVAYARDTRVRPNQSIGCVHADQLDAIARSVWNRSASEIWK